MAKDKPTKEEARQFIADVEEAVDIASQEIIAENFPTSNFFDHEKMEETANQLSDLKMRGAWTVTARLFRLTK